MAYELESWLWPFANIQCKIPSEMTELFWSHDQDWFCSCCALIITSFTDFYLTVDMGGCGVGGRDRDREFKAAVGPVVPKLVGLDSPGEQDVGHSHLREVALLQ